MYLTRVEIDLTSRQRAKALTQLGAYHHLVEASFPWAENADPRPRHLWRLDEIGGRLFMLVLSEDRPDLTILGQYGDPKLAGTKDYEPFLNQLTQGARMRFRLTANPTRAVMHSGEARGRVYPHVTVAQQAQWLVDRTTKAGFEIVLQPDSENLAFDVVSRDHPILRHRGNKAVRLSRVSFEGILKITDLERFKQTLTQGIGREKAYGMGLLTVVPLVTP